MFYDSKSIMQHLEIGYCIRCSRPSKNLDRGAECPSCVEYEKARILTTPWWINGQPGPH